MTEREGLSHSERRINVKHEFGFTLIELLIVVAIIGILAAIAIPNFLQAQVRAKVARGVADLRTIDLGLREYHVDYNGFVPCNNFSLALNPGIQIWPTLELLTTPSDYLRSVSFEDPFRPNGRFVSGFGRIEVPPTDFISRIYKYALWNRTGMAQFDDPEIGRWFHLECAGPDRGYHNMSGIFNTTLPSDSPLIGRLIYDPTNGTISTGSVWRVGGQKSEFTGTNSPAIFFEMVVARFGGG